MDGGSDPYKPESVMRTLRCIYVNCFKKDLDFSLRSAQNYEIVLFWTI